MSQPKINFYVDVVSPFGYLAFYMLRNSPTFKNVSLTYVPVLLGGLHKQCNNTAPIFIKNKAEYINKERERWAELFNIPLRKQTPNGFPIGTVNAMRAVVALQVEGVSNENVARCLEVLWSAIWCPEAKVLEGLDGKGKASNGEWDVKSPEVLKALLAIVVGDEVAGKAVGKIASQEVKDQLMGNTKLAFEKGAFGLPWFDCVNAKGEEEGFWGFDHLGMVVRFLGLEGEGERGRSGETLRALL